MLEFIGKPYEERRYQAAEKEQWFADKYALGFDFPNVRSSTPWLYCPTIL